MTSTGLRIRSARSAAPPEWDRLWSACDHSVYFQSREWAEIWAVVTRGKYRPSPRVVLFSDGRSALLPLLSAAAMKGFVKNFYSSCHGTYGGPVCEAGMTDEHSALLKNYMTSRLRNLQWRMNPFDPFTNAGGEVSVLTDATSALALSGDFDSIVKGFAHQNRTNIRKALDCGVSVREAADVADWKAYFAVYQDSLRRWGDEATSSYAWEVFEEMHARRSPNIKLWLAVHDGQVIAGNLCLYSKKVVASWHGAALKDFFELRPVNLLWHHLIKDACGRKFAWLDFGPSGGHEGVLRFKRTFGTKEKPCPLIVTSSPFCRLANRIWRFNRRLP